MDPVRWVGRRANRPLVAGGLFGAVALAFTVGYVTLVESARHGIFVVSAIMVVVAGTIATAVAGTFVWHILASDLEAASYRAHGLAGFLVGVGGLFVAPPLALILMGGAYVVDVVQTGGILGPVLILGWLFNAFAWGLIGTAIAIVVTAGVPLVLTTVTGVGIGYVQRRYSV